MMEFIFPIRVYYEDTDVAGVVYHANYLKFMERARTEWLRQLGLDQLLLIDQDIAFAIRKATLEYLKPARFNDALEVHSVIEQVRGASLVFKQKIYPKGQSENVLCHGEVKVVTVTMSTMEARPLPKEFREVLRNES